jgi:hypothetical protein
MDQHGRRERAEAKAYIWDRTIGLGFTVAGAIPVWGRLATPAEVLVTHALGTGGAYTNTPDRYQHHPATEALSAVAHLEQGSPQPGAAREALLTYTRTLQVLGTPVAPIAPDDGLAEKLVQETAADVLGGMVGRRLRVTDGLDGVVGGALVDEATDLADDSG